MPALFRVTEDDLATLEHVLPQIARDLCTALTTPAAPRIRKQLRQVQEIVTNIRWDYGPPTEVTTIPAGGPDES